MTSITFYSALEILLLFLLGKTLKGRLLSKDINKNIKIISKIILASFVLIMRLSILFNVVIDILLNTLLYTLYFRYILNFNWRKSLFIIQIHLFIFQSVLLFILPFIIFHYHTDYSIFKTIIILMEICLLTLIKIYKINIHKVNILNEKWVNINISGKFSTLIMIIYIIMANLGGLFFIFLFILLKKESIINNSIYNVITILYILLILIILTTIIMIFRTIKMEEYKILLGYKKISLFLKALVSKSTQEEIQEYAQVFIQGLKINNYIKLKELLDSMISRCMNFDYIIDRKLREIDFDYTDIIHLLSKLVDDKLLKDRKIRTRFLLDDENITCIFTVKTDEIAHKRFRNIVYVNLKNLCIFKKHTIAYSGGYSIFTINIDKN